MTEKQRNLAWAIALAIALLLLLSVGWWTYGATLTFGGDIVPGITLESIIALVAVLVLLGFWKPIRRDPVWQIAVVLFLGGVLIYFGLQMNPDCGGCQAAWIPCPRIGKESVTYCAQFYATQTAEAVPWWQQLGH